MCRLYGFRASEPTKVECSLVLAQNALLSQSREDLRGEKHPDGWGIAVYEDGVPKVEKRDTAAFSDVHFSVAAARAYAWTVVAHVRAATVGGASLENTHPFVHGSFTFAHNGTIGLFDAVSVMLAWDIDPDLLAHRKGCTDSEFAFYWLLARLERAGAYHDGRCTDMGTAVRVLGDSVRELDRLCEEAGAKEPAKLNFLLTDGNVLVATRLRNTLYWVKREGIHDCEVCGIPHVHHEKGKNYRAVVVASEPISDEPWQEVPEGAVLSVDGDACAELHEFPT